MNRPTVIAAAAVVLLAGCGSSAKPRHGAGLDPGIKFADCMRANGVPSFPDPSGGGGGVQIPNSVDTNAPAFQRARKACGGLLPGPGGRQAATAEQKASMLKLSRCMRAHGVSGFPDPVSSPPASPVGMAIAFGRPGAFIVVPQSLDPQSPTFETAAKVCQLPGT
ncbi:MAG TPA: hypothetical protein VG410_02200 [Solirubrobacteraceae bacterium]|nr:hypothetical protein [Solirubrobacteraceae bacterium]